MPTNIEKYLKNINPLDIKYKNTRMTYRQILQSESQRLKGLLQKHIELYYEHYRPKVYDRGNHGGNLHSALTVDDACKISISGKATISIEVNDNAIHNSILDGSEANSFWLLNDGWSVKKDVWFKNYENFGFRKGGHFVEDGIADFNIMNKLGIRIAVKSNGYKV